MPFEFSAGEVPAAGLSDCPNAKVDERANATVARTEAFMSGLPILVNFDGPRCDFELERCLKSRENISCWSVRLSTNRPYIRRTWIPLGFGRRCHRL